jgi:SAM-dependent methyltransferase
LSDGIIVCSNGHQFSVEEGILNLMPTEFADRNLQNEASYFDRIFESGRNFKINPNHSIGIRLRKQAIDLFEQTIAREWPDHQNRDINLGEIACGDGSAIWHFGDMDFRSVTYIGTDISLKSLVYGVKNYRVPPNWVRQYVRASANVPIFRSNSMDLVLSLGALHHLSADSAVRWIARSMKKGGLFIMQEPSHKNPFAKIGRKLIRGANTEDEKPLDPSYITNLSYRCGLRLIFERGMDFLTGPMAYLLGMIRLPDRINNLLYYFGRSVDYFFRSPSLNYRFLQIYKKEDRE